MTGAEERIRWVLERLPDSDAVTVSKADVRAVLAELDAACLRLPASEPLEWKTSVPSPYPYSDAPLAARIVACTHDIDAAQVDRTDGCYTDVVGLLAEHDHATDVAAANAMGLTGDWDTDDVNESVTNALHEYRGLRAALDAARADVERLRGLWPKNGFGEDMNVHQLVANHRAWTKRAWEAQSAAETERDALRAEAERLREECNATADSTIELAAQRAAALSDCRDLQREVELLRGQVGSWDSAQAVWDAIGRIRKSLGGDTDV